TGQIAQVTHEPSTGRLHWEPGAGRPTWTPDGQAIVYLRFVRETDFSRKVPALVRRVSLDGGEPETLSAPPRLFRSVFYLPDGRLAWTVIEPEQGASPGTTRIEVMSPQGTVSTLRTLSGYVDHVVVSPTGDGLYCDRRHPRRYSYRDVLFVPLPEGPEQEIVTVSRRANWDQPFAVAAGNKTLYVGDAGRLWKIALPGGAREHLAFRARVKLEIQDPVLPPKWAPPALGSSAPPRSVLWPRLSPDGRSLVFGAAGYLWLQPLEGGQAPLRPGFGGPAQRLFAGSAFENWPAFSPDGRQLAFIRRQYGKDEVRVFNFDSGQTRTGASGPPLMDLSWSPDGQRLLSVERVPRRNRVVAVNLSDGKKQALAGRASRPHFSADGQSLYYSGPPRPGTLYRLRLKEKAKPEAVTQVSRFLSNALVSLDGMWLAFRRNSEIWVAPLSKEPVKEQDVRQLSPEGGDTFAFTPDGSAVIYAAGNRVWQHPIAGGEREEIPIRLELPRPTPPPMLVRRVRVLDFASGGFGVETSMFIEQGRIRWMGSERGRELPRETVTLDAEGRFAIPGLFDMHVHTGFRRQAALLAYGVTSVRDTGGWLPGLNAVADRSQATNQPVPRYFFAGDIFHSAKSGWGALSLRIYDEKDARSYVRRWKERGAQFIKAYLDLSWPLQRAVAEEARRLGLPVAGHNEGVLLATKSVTLGYASLEHIPNSNRLSDDVLQMLALAGTRWCPTLAVRRGNALLLRNEPERLADPKFRAFTPEWIIRAAQQRSVTRRAGDKAVRGYWMEKLASIRAAHRRGVKLLAGVDAVPTVPVFRGSSLHWELEYFVQADIPPLEVLRIATQEAAATVGAEDNLGTLEPGKLADIVLLDANPLEDIKNTQTIWRVIKGGWLFDPDKLRPPVSASSEQ
ncbi:MAG: amidohydrolase family protein, partial [Terriglobia bacterium]